MIITRTTAASMVGLLAAVTSTSLGQSAVVEVESISGVCTAELVEAATGLGVDFDLTDHIVHEPTNPTGFDAYPYLDGFCESCLTAAQPDWWWVYGSAGISESLAVDATDADPDSWPPNIDWYVSGDIGLDLGTSDGDGHVTTADGTASFTLDRRLVIRVSQAIEARLSFSRLVYAWSSLEGQPCLDSGEAVCEADATIDVSVPWNLDWAPDIEGVESAVWEGVLQPGTYAIEVTGSGSVASRPAAAGTPCENANSFAGSSFGLVFDILGEAGPTPGDFDGDGDVDGADMGQFFALWGTSDPAADYDGNGNVDGADFGMFLQYWG